MGAKSATKPAKPKNVAAQPKPASKSKPTKKVAKKPIKKDKKLFDPSTFKSGAVPFKTPSIPKQQKSKLLAVISARPGVTAKYIKVKLLPIICKEKVVRGKFSDSQMKSWRFVRSMTRGNLLALKEKSGAKLTEDQRVSL